LERFSYNDDGKASARAVEIIFNKNKNLSQYVSTPWIPPDPNKKQLLVNVGDGNAPANVQALYFLLEKIDQDKYDVTIGGWNAEPFRAQSEQLCPGVKIILSQTVFNRTKREVVFRNNTLDRQYKKYFGDFTYDLYVNIDTKNLLPQKIWAGKEGVRRIAAINNGWLVEPFLKKFKKYYEKTYVFGENQEAELYPAEENVIPVSSNQIRASRGDKLTVLFLGGFDSTNITFATCINELKARGHNVVVVVRTLRDEINNKYFTQNDIWIDPRIRFGELALNYVDIAVCPPVIFHQFRGLERNIRERKILTVSFASLFSSIAMRGFPDFVFCLGADKIREFKENYLQYNYILSGNPQYDVLVENRAKQTDLPTQDVKNVLVIDQGGYPYGPVGKQQLADTLTDFARNNPEQHFDIKVRYHKDAVGQTLHNVSEYLVDYLIDAPENLSILESQEPLETILLGYDAMVCTWSTAYIDAMMFGIPIVLIEGFDSVDVFDVRTQRIADAYDHLRATGCLYHYTALLGKKLPFRKISQDYVQNEVHHADVPAAPAIVKFLEDSKRVLVIPEVRYEEHVSSDVDHFYDPEQTGARAMLDVNDEEYQYLTAYKYQLNSRLQESAYTNRCMGNVLDLTPLYSLNFNIVIDHSRDIDLKGYNSRIRLEFIEIFKQIQSDYFDTPEAQARLETDKILQDYYFDFLYRTQQYKALKNYQGKLAAHESYEYNIGRVYLRKRRIFKAYKHLINFLNALIDSKEGVQLLKQRRLRISIRAFMRGYNYFFFGLYFVRHGRFEIFNHLGDEVIVKNPLLTFFLMREYNRKQRYEDSLQIYEEFWERNENKKWRRQKKLKHILIDLLKRIYTEKIHKEAAITRANLNETK
jgi:hypothetical protein